MPSSSSTAPLSRGERSLHTPQHHSSEPAALCSRTQSHRKCLGYLRGNKLAITVFDDYDDIVDKTCDAWNFFEQDPLRIASITTEHGQQSIIRAVGIRRVIRISPVDVAGSCRD